MKSTVEKIGDIVASSKIERLRPNQITTDPRVQRPLDQKQVAAIVKEFDINALGVPSASRRPDGTIVMLDGQHRNAALVQLNRGNEHFSYKVFEGLSLQEEAHLFRMLNNFRRPTPVDLFRMGVTEEDPEIVACDRFLTTAGFTSVPGHANSFRAVNALLAQYRMDKGSAKRTLMVLSGAWGATRSSGDGRLFVGLGIMMFRYADLVNDGRMVEKLAKEPGGPAALLGRARGLADMRRIHLRDAVADIVTNVYNFRITKGITPLPGWAIS